MATITEMVVELGVDDGEVRSMGSKLAPVAKAGAIAIGAAITAGVVAGIGQEAVTDRIAAQLDLTEKQSKMAGEIAGDVYGNAFGESFEDVSQTVGDVMGTFDELDAGGIERVTEKAENLKAAFDIEDAVTRAGVLVESGLAGDVDEAMDLITASMQEVAPGLRDELGEATTEYSKFFSDLGFSGEETFALLAQADDKFSLDKTGDAIKELSVRASDPAVAESFKAIGLDAEQMGDDILAGGDTARGAFDEIVDGLLEMESPSERAQAAIGLFGTPLEDLSTAQIPEFLESLQDTGGGLEDVAGRADKMGETLNDNVKTKATGAWRSLKQSFTENVGGAIIPLLTKLMDWLADKLPAAIDVMQDAFDAVASWWAENGPAIMDRAKQLFNDVLIPAFEAVVDAVKGVIEWWQNLSPAAQGFIKTLGIAAVAGLAFFKVLTTLKMGFGIVLKAYSTLKLALLSNPFIAITAAVIAIVTLIVLNWDTIVEFLKEAWEKIKKIASTVWNSIKDFFKKFWPIILGIFTGGLSLLVGLIVKNWDKIQKGIRTAWDAIKRFFKRFWPIILGIFTGGIGTLVGLLVKNWDKITRKVKDVWNAIVSWIGGIPGRIGGALGGLFDKAKELATGARDWIKDRFNHIVDFLKGIPGRVGSAVSGMWDGIQSGFKTVINTIIGWWNGLGFKLPSFSIPFGPTIGGQEFGPKYGDFRIPTLHQGGIVPGVPGQEVLAVLEAGEEVTPADETDGGQGIFDGATLVFQGTPESVSRDVANKVGFEIRWASG